MPVYTPGDELARLSNIPTLASTLTDLGVSVPAVTTALTTYNTRMDKLRTALRNAGNFSDADALAALDAADPLTAPAFVRLAAAFPVGQAQASIEAAALRALESAWSAAVPAVLTSLQTPFGADVSTLLAQRTALGGASLETTAAERSTWDATKKTAFATATTAARRMDVVADLLRRMERAGGYPPVDSPYADVSRTAGNLTKAQAIPGERPGNTVLRTGATLAVLSVSARAAWAA